MDTSITVHKLKLRLLNKERMDWLKVSALNKENGREWKFQICGHPNICNNRRTKGHKCYSRHFPAADIHHLKDFFFFFSRKCYDRPFTSTASNTLIQMSRNLLYSASCNNAKLLIIFELVNNSQQRSILQRKKKFP